MGTKRRASRALARGDRVLVPLGSVMATGTIVEDRGFIGVGGRRILAVRLEGDDLEAPFEVAEEEIERAKPTD